MFLFFGRFVDEPIRRLESIQADGSFITPHKLFHRFKDFYHRPAKFIHPSLLQRQTQKPECRLFDEAKSERATLLVAYPIYLQKT